MTVQQLQEQFPLVYEAVFRQGYRQALEDMLQKLQENYKPIVIKEDTAPSH